MLILDSREVRKNKKKKEKINVWREVAYVSLDRHE